MSEEKKKQKPKRRWLKRILWFFLIDFLLLAIVLLMGMAYIRHRLNTLPIMDAQYLSTYETSKILDKNGEIIWEPTDHRSVSLTYDEIPEFYKTALIAVEDKEYWQSHGISIKGTINMVLGVIRSKVDKSFEPRGGSTIEQQLIKNKFYGRGEGYDVTTRKIQELFLAIQMDENYTKEEILTFYVNDLEYAEGSTGIGAIMKTYFNKTPDSYKERTIETIAELSYLAGLSQAPDAYNLYDHPDKAKERKDVVLDVLLEQGLITDTEYTEAKVFDLSTNLQPRGWESEVQIQKNLAYKHYTDGVMEELTDLGYDITNLSVTVQTFFDPELFQTITALVQNPEYYLDEQQQVGVAVVNTDGVVIALVGSSKPGDEFNRAMSASRSSGSSMKPFTAYGPLFQYFGDKYNTASMFDTSDYPYPGSTAVMRNYGGGVYGNQTIQKALRYSYNTPVGRIDDEILGPVRMKTFLHGLGLDVKETYSSVDGIGLNVSPLQSAAAYNALNNNGLYIKPRFIQSITFSDGSVKEIEPKTYQAMNPSVAYVLSQILRGVPAGDGTAGAAAIPSFVGYAGKTGSVKFDDSVNPPAPYGDGGSDTWYCSYTNGGYAVSVWCGYDIPNTSPRIPDSYTGQQRINRDIQILLNGNRDVSDWEKPEGVEKISGDGLFTQYKVTDSKDVNVIGISWADISGYTASEIKKAKLDNTVPEDWEEYEFSPWYSYYKQNGPEIPSVIDRKTYNKLGDW